MIIIQEISINYLTARIINARGYLEAELNKDMEQAISMLSKLNSQLPDKEAADIMDDEKAMCMIYDAYIKEKKIRYANGVARLLSPEAIALSPALHFPISPSDLLERAGFTLIDAEQVVELIDMPPEYYTAEQVLEYFGFRLNEEYAMDVASPLSETQLIDNDSEQEV